MTDLRCLVGRLCVFLAMINNYLLAIALCAAFICTSGLLRAQDKPSLRTVHISGHAQVTVEPDRASIVCGVTKKAATASAAMSEVARISHDLGKAFAQLDIPPTDLKTESITLQPNYIYKDGNSILDGYMASAAVIVTLKETAKVARVVDAAAKSGGNVISNITFFVSNDRALRTELLAKAVANARIKAALIAAELDMKVGKPVSIIEEGQPMHYMEKMRSSYLQADDSSMAPDVNAGTMQISVTVSATFELE